MMNVKICGITEPVGLTAAIEAGADFVGLVFHPSSPRFLDIEVAAQLARYVPERVKIVGLFVDPDDALLGQVLDNVRLDMIQLHGNETPERVRAIKARFNVHVMKALPVATAEDLEQIASYEPVADWLLLDSKHTPTPPSSGLRPPSPQGEKGLFGGSGKTFDWNLLANHTFNKPWMLAGGLTPENIRDALSVLTPDAVDVSSGVEKSKGVKDPAKITAFIANARKQG